MSLYTRTGDAGTTGLIGNVRVKKYDLRIAAYGTVDELNCSLGSARAELARAEDASELDNYLGTMQSELFDIGADLATVGGDAAVPRIQRAVTRIEAWIDASEAELPALRNFILPGGSLLAAAFHTMRSTARRAERQVWELIDREIERGEKDHQVPLEIAVYLNRVSDLAFSWARLANHRLDIADVPWLSERPEDA